MKKVSGGLVLFEVDEKNDQIFVLVAHPGGPFLDKDEGWWSIPKGEPEPNEDIFNAAVREFEEETGMASRALLNLDQFHKKMERKFLHGLLAEWSENRQVICNEITMEYLKSGKWTFLKLSGHYYQQMKQSRNFDLSRLYLWTV